MPALRTRLAARLQPAVLLHGQAGHGLQPLAQSWRARHLVVLRGRLAVRLRAALLPALLRGVPALLPALLRGVAALLPALRPARVPCRPRGTLSHTLHRRTVLPAAWAPSRHSNRATWQLLLGDRTPVANTYTHLEATRL